MKGVRRQAAKQRTRQPRLAPRSSPGPRGDHRGGSCDGSRLVYDVTGNWRCPSTHPGLPSNRSPATHSVDLPEPAVFYHRVVARSGIVGCRIAREGAFGMGPWTPASADRRHLQGSSNDRPGTTEASRSFARRSSRRVLGESSLWPPSCPFPDPPTTISPLPLRDENGSASHPRFRD